MVKHKHKDPQGGLSGYLPLPPLGQPTKTYELALKWPSTEGWFAWDFWRSTLEKWRHLHFSPTRIVERTIDICQNEGQ